MQTKITNENIKELVFLYFSDKSKLPSGLTKKPLNDWIVSEVTDFSYVFSNPVISEVFNEPLDNWDVSNATNMKGMFMGCKSFNKNLNKWKLKVGNVNNMSMMFMDCYFFEGLINEWDVSMVNDMSNMFNSCTRFNQNLNDWEPINVTNVEGMFKNCRVFNKPLNNWFAREKTKKVTNMDSMFMGCINFNKSLNTWDVSMVTNMNQMFRGCKIFNQPLDNWNVSMVTNMNQMFRDCTNFNQPLDNWDVSMVTNMSMMFRGCRSFNQPLNNWNVTSETMIVNMFDNCAIEEQNKPIPRTRVTVNPHHVHCVASKINYSKLNDFFKKENNNSIDINEAPPDIIDYADFIENSLLYIIDKNNESKDIKQSQKTKLHSIMLSRLNMLNYDDLQPTIRISIINSLEYLKLQPPNFQKMYVSTFLHDNVNAYEGDEGMSCAGGILDRIITSFTGACVAMISEGIENDSYEELKAITVADPNKMIDLYIQDWYKLHNKDSPEKFPLGMNIQEKKENLRQYLLQKFPNEGQLIDNKIIVFENAIGFEDDDFTYGGKNKTKKYKKYKKTKKTKKNAKLKTSIKKNKNNKKQKRFTKRK